MSETRTPFAELEPRLIHRACGGWLALSPERAKLRIGAVGDTEDDAWRNWKASARAWAALLATPPRIDIDGLRPAQDTLPRRFRRRPKRRSIEWLRRKYLARAADTPRGGETE